MRLPITYILVLCSLTLYSQETEKTIKMDKVYAKHDDNGWYTIGIHGPSYRNCNGKHCNGLLIDTFQNGQIKECAFYIDGQIRGSFIEYYENGQIRAFGSTDSSGFNIGKSYNYHANGQLESVDVFKNRKRIQTQTFSEAGKIEYYQELNKDCQLLYDFEFNNEGDTLSGHILVDSVNLIYNCWLKHDNGKMERTGQQKYTTRGWSKIGIWYYYDDKGQLIRTEINN